jgi:hypothetical protein
MGTEKKGRELTANHEVSQVPGFGLVFHSDSFIFSSLTEFLDIRMFYPA